MTTFEELDKALNIMADADLILKASDDYRAGSRSKEVVRIVNIEDEIFRLAEKLDKELKTDKDTQLEFERRKKKILKDYKKR